MIPNATVLHNHTSEETAYEIPDYPYGFKLRCKCRWWIETKPKHGQRMMQQTSNPKKNNTWNKPKGSTYSDFLVLYKDENNHVHNHGTSLYASNIINFLSSGFYAQLDEDQLNRLNIIIRASRRADASSWERYDAIIKALNENTENRTTTIIRQQLLEARPNDVYLYQADVDIVNDALEVQKLTNKLIDWNPK